MSKNDSVYYNALTSCEYNLICKIKLDIIKKKKTTHIAVADIYTSGIVIQNYNVIFSQIFRSFGIFLGMLEHKAHNHSRTRVDRAAFMLLPFDVTSCRALRESTRRARKIKQ